MKRSEQEMKNKSSVQTPMYEFKRGPLTEEEEQVR